MDQTLQQLKRQALDDPEAQKKYNVHLCRAKGHQFTTFIRFEDPITKNYVEVRVCWRCHNTEIQADQEKHTPIPEIVTYQNSYLHGSPCHAMISFKIKKTKVRRARKKGQIASVVSENFFDIKGRTACGIDVRIEHRGNMTYQKEVSCQRCIKNKKRMKQARENSKKIYPELYATFENTFKQRAKAEYPTPYVPPLKLDANG